MLQPVVEIWRWYGHDTHGRFEQESRPYYRHMIVPAPFQAGYEHIHVGSDGIRKNGFDARMPLGAELSL